MIRQTSLHDVQTVSVTRFAVQQSFANRALGHLGETDQALLRGHDLRGETTKHSYEVIIYVCWVVFNTALNVN